MTLSCDYECDYEPGMLMWHIPNQWTTHNKRLKQKCCSCDALVPRETKCLEFRRYKVPEHDVEIRIWGEDGDGGPARASAFMCFECGWRYLALERHGYAINIYDDMRTLMIEHDDLAAAGHAGCL
jgi:hypothetical protein